MNEILNPKNDITVKAVFQEGDVLGSLTIDGITYKVHLGDVGTYSMGNGRFKHKFTLVEV